MIETIEGFYRNGKVELLKPPSDAEDVRVLVTFLRAQSDQAKGEPLPPGPDREAAVSALLAEMEPGIHLGGGPYPTREDLYDRDRGRSGSR